MNIPNYNSFHEGHYDIFWMPYLFMSKKIAKIYVRLRGRKDYFIDELIFTTPGMIKRIAEKVLKEGEFYLVPHLDGIVMGNVARVYFYLKLNLKDIKDRRFIVCLTRNKLLRFLSLCISGILVKILVLFGFSRSFNLIYFKR